MHILRKLSLTYLQFSIGKYRSIVIMSLLFVFILSLAMVIYSILIPSVSNAQEGTTISGRVIDTRGNPITDITIFLRRYDALNHDNSRRQDDAIQIKTDAKGSFTFSNIRNTSLQLGISSYTKIGYEINVQSIEFGEITLYPDRSWVHSSIRFGLSDGSKGEGIIITTDIREKSRIRTRVLYSDGSPVANTKIYVYRQTIPFFGSNKGYRMLIEETDVDGYFIEYLPASVKTGYYITLAVEHQNLYAKAVPFLLRDQTEVTLKLNGLPSSQNGPPLEYSARFRALEAYIDPPSVWVVNPTNGHTYMVTQPQTIKDAMTQAGSENAYLIAINDEAEEKWLGHVFGNGQFWIGLSDAEEEGIWKWHSGEPVEYTNWAPNPLENGDSDTKDYVITGLSDWKWRAYAENYAARKQNERIPHLERAILEKSILNK